LITDIYVYVLMRRLNLMHFPSVFGTSQIILDYAVIIANFAIYSPFNNT